MAPVADHHKTKRCPHCGESLPTVRDAFCCYCRESLEGLDDPAAIDLLSLECPECGEWYASDLPRCPLCGHGDDPSMIH